MKKILLLASIIFAGTPFIFAQTFPSTEINNILHSSFDHHSSFTQIQNSNNSSSSHLNSELLQLSEVKNTNLSPTRIHNNSSIQTTIDTLIIGLVPNDTLRITGVWNHTGPIWVLGTGVLIFNHAIVHDTGDVYVFQNGKWIADSSSFFFPQNYFYERSFLVAQNGSAHFGNCSMNYSGMSHGLTVADNGVMDWNNVHQNDWTTCGLVGNASMTIHNCNQSGEYILSDSCHANFNHADTIILWHQLPSTALINYSFPNTNPVYNYVFDNAQIGVSGINYHVSADSCSDVMWALMPVNGSDVTISNSSIRLIGAWFVNGDTTTAHGIFNNSNYSNYITPLADRNLHLINTSVQTWSMYVFDSSQVNMDSCQFGEVGTQQRASVFADNVLVDGSGGYFWATDSSFTIATNSISYNTCRSEKKGLFILAYSWLPFSGPTSIHNSEIICVQNTLTNDPVPYDASVAWLSKIDAQDTISVNMIYPIPGSAWINQGPMGNPIDFASYSVYYQLPAVSQNWFPVVVDSMMEISHNSLANWNTNGLIPGTYILKLVLNDNFGDSVEGMKVIELLSNPLSVNAISSVNNFSVFPNPFSDVTILKTNADLKNATLIIYDAFGKEVRSVENISGNEIKIEKGNLGEGIYFVAISENGEIVGKAKIILK